MATTETQIRARTGKQFLDELAKDEREIWLNGEKITNPLEHPLLVSGAESIARVFDLQHEHADEMLMPSPDDGSLVNVTHVIPRSKEDLERRRRAFEIIAAATAGMMGRTPDYLNVTFACFAGRAGRVGAARQRAKAPRTSSPTRRRCATAISRRLTRSSTRRSTARSPRPSRLRERSRSTRSARRDAGIVVRGARMLATLAPLRRRADGLPGLGHPAAGRQLRACLRDPDGDARASSSSAATRTRRAAATSTTRSRPGSTRWTPSRSSTMSSSRGTASSLAGDPLGYSEVISDTGWRGHIMHQAMSAGPHQAPLRVRARSPHGQHDGRRALRPHPGEARPDLEHGRALPVGARRRRGGLVAWTTAVSGIRTTVRSSPCAVRCRSGCRASTSCSS